MYISASQKTYDMLGMFLCIILVCAKSSVKWLPTASWWSSMLGCSGVNGCTMNDQECSWCYQSMNHFVWQWNSSQRGSSFSLKMFCTVCAALLCSSEYYPNVIISWLISSNPELTICSIIGCQKDNTKTTHFTRVWCEKKNQS